MTKPPTVPDFDKIDLELPNGWFSSYDMACIYPALIKSKKDDVYLEIGVHLGKSLAFARKYFKGDIFGIDIVDNKINLRGVNFIHGDAAEVNWSLPLRVLFIDGNHGYDYVKADWDKYAPFVVSGGWVFFHDCDATSPGVVQVFEEIGAGWKNKGLSDNPRCSMGWVQKI